MSTEIRLQRFIAQAGVAARRKAEDLIAAGRVTVNGKVVTEQGTKIDPTVDMVAVDGEGLHREEPVYILFNKPKGCITSLADDEGRLTVMDYLPNLPARVAPVGRLDFYTEGVLLLTNDGELASRLLAPKHHVEKTYHVKVRGQLSATNIKQLRQGVTLEDGTRTMPAEVVALPGESKHSWVAMTLHEGKSRQIHRMMEAVGFTVTKLQRVAFGNLTHYGLRVGDARELNQSELNDLRALAGLTQGRAVARGRWQARREDTELSRRAHARAQLARAEAEGNAVPPRDRGEDARDARPARPARAEGRLANKQPAGASARSARGAAARAPVGRPPSPRQPLARSPSPRSVGRSSPGASPSPTAAGRGTARGGKRPASGNLGRVRAGVTGSARAGSRGEGRAAGGRGGNPRGNRGGGR